MKKLLLLLLLPFTLLATQVTVKNTGGNVNAGGTYVGGVAPGVTDTLICNSTSGNLTMNVGTTVGKFDCQSGYVGTVTMTNALTVAGDITLRSGMGISGAGGLIQSGTGTITSNTRTWPNVLTFNGTSITHTLSGKFTVTGAFSSAGTTATTLNGDTLVCNGGITVQTSTLSGTTKLYAGGGTIQAAASSAVISLDLSFNGTVTLAAASVFVGGVSIKYVSGAITTTGNTLNIATAGGTIDCAGITFNNISFGWASQGTVTINSLLTMTGTLTVPTGVNIIFAGTAGWTCATLSRPNSTSAVTNTLAAGITYTVTTAITLNNNSCVSHSTFICSTVNGTKAILTLQSAATQKNGCYNFTDIDASAGKTIWTYDGVITRCTNINAFTQPNTVGN